MISAISLRASLAVLAGSAVGGLARYWGSAGLARLLGPAFPWGTLAVNVAGCGLMGLVMTWSVERSAWSPEVRLLLTTGLLGGFTTFSAFGYETLRLAQDGDWARAAANIGANVGIGLLALWLGATLARGAA